MDTFKRNFINIIKSALLGENNLKISDFTDYDEIYSLAFKHKIANIIFYGLESIGIADIKKNNLLIDEVLRNIILDERQKYEAEKIYSLFEENDIKYIKLKGNILKNFYPRSDMRYMGDIDILIRLDQYDTIKSLMKGQGYNKISETDHEYIWRKDDIEIEFHKRLMPTRNRNFHEYFKDGWHLAKPVNVNKCEYCFDNEIQFVYLFTHFAKHYRNSGIGIKHLLDLWLYIKANPDLDYDIIVRELEKLYLDKFYHNIMETLNVWFDSAPDTEMTDFITDTMFENGVYGSMVNKATARSMELNPEVKSFKLLRLKGLLYIVFLPFEKMKERYSVLKKAPILLPYFWVVRWISYIKRGRKNMSAYVNMLTPGKMEEYKEKLNYVGLDYH